MAIASLLGPNPLTWKQTSPILLSHDRPPLSAKPIKFSAATFNYKQASAKFDVKLKCFPSAAEEKSHRSCPSPFFTSSPPLGRVGGKCGQNDSKTKGLFLYRSSIYSTFFGGIAALTAANGTINWWTGLSVFLGILAVYLEYRCFKETVVKLQVGLLGTGRTLQRDLNQIAEYADTFTWEGLNSVLTETTVALLRHSDHCIAGYSSVTPKFTMHDAEVFFKQLSCLERIAFDEETFVNVKSIKKYNLASQRANGFHNQYIVVTILLGIGGECMLPRIKSSADLKEALQKLSCLTEIRAVEVLWTPQHEANTLLEDQLHKYYPHLNYF